MPTAFTPKTQGVPQQPEDQRRTRTLRRDTAVVWDATRSGIGPDAPTARRVSTDDAVRPARARAWRSPNAQRLRHGTRRSRIKFKHSCQVPPDDDIPKPCQPAQCGAITDSGRPPLHGLPGRRAVSVAVGQEELAGRCSVPGRGSTPPASGTFARESQLHVNPASVGPARVLLRQALLDQSSSTNSNGVATFSVLPRARPRSSSSVQP